MSGLTMVSRSGWGARAARGGPGPLNRVRVEGIALHWPAMTDPIRGRDRVARALRGWQAFHMDSRGWSDIAYQVAVDQDGTAYRLRGLETQSGANGNTDLNQRYGAVLLVLAPGEEPTPAMVTTTRAVIAEHRRLFPASRRIVGHGDIRPGGTRCPGPAVTAAIRRGAFNPTAGPPRRPNVDTAIEATRKALRANQSGPVRTALRKALEALQSIPRRRP